MHTGHLERLLHTDVIDTLSCPPDATVTNVTDEIHTDIAEVGHDDCFGMQSFETRTGVVGHSDFVVQPTSLPVRDLVAGVLSRPKPLTIVRQQPRGGPPPYTGPGHRKIKHRVSVPVKVSRRG